MIKIKISKKQELKLIFDVDIMLIKQNILKDKDFL